MKRVEGAFDLDVFGVDHWSFIQLLVNSEPLNLEVTVDAGDPVALFERATAHAANAMAGVSPSSGTALINGSTITG